MASQRLLLKHLRNIENRLCADCDCAIGQGNVYFSVDFRVWLCEDCYSAHVSHFPKEKYKSLQDEWTVNDINMATQWTNSGRNNTLEQNIVPGWPKLSPDSTNLQRQYWIRAKYDARIFEFPLRLGESVKLKNVDRQRAFTTFTEDDGQLPVRIAEVFAVIGPKKIRQPLDNGITLEDIDLHPGVLSAIKSDDEQVGKIPELVGQCIFPLGLRLSAVDVQPITFSFVLTNESREKLYGAALQFYELMEPSELENLVGKDTASALLTKYPVIYCPKSIAILSFYSFFHLFHEFLVVLYHISLSNSPLPLERFVLNFLREVPVPPEGLVQVIYPLPDRVLHLCRPATNKPPMSDFSYLPLFLKLSLDNVINVFRCICSEHSICFVSSVISLLTPVQEAFLSFLFPLQWQGCYIPVMPLHMSDILEAPVPILVGVHSAYFQQVPVTRRPARVVFVDLDNNKVYLGSGAPITSDATSVRYQSNGQEESLVIPLVPKAIASKLKAKLDECCGSFNTNTDLLEKLRTELHTCDRAYVGNEHLVPMTSFYDSSHSSANMSNSDSEARWFCSLSVKQSSTKASVDVARRTSVGSTTKKGLGATQGLLIGHILDPVNNFLPLMSFDSMEIRLAFQRVFVKCIGDYRDFQRNARTDGTIASNFDVDAFMASQQNDQFVKQIIETQMFAKFFEESDIDTPEKRYFFESVSKKRNRSVLATFKKEATPFLDDNSEQIAETCRAPEPSNWGLSLENKFSYSQFPMLDISCAGPIRNAPILVKKRQKKKQLTLTAQTIGRMMSVSNLDGMDDDDVVELDASDGQLLDQLIVTYKARNSASVVSIIKLQAFYRQRKAKRAFLILLVMILRIQKCFRTWGTRRYWRNLRTVAKEVWDRHRRRIIYRTVRQFVCNRIKAVTLLQSFCRGIKHQRWYASVRVIAIRLQAIVRGYKARKSWIILRRSVNKIICFVKGFRQIKALQKKLQAHFRYCLSALLLFWEIARVSLIYRTQFWVGIKNLHEEKAQSIFICIGVVSAEIRQICTILQEKCTVLEFAYNAPSSSTALVRYAPANRAVYLKALGKTSTAAITAAGMNEENERKQLYTVMKRHCTPQSLQELYVLLPGIIGPKKRKQTLSKLIWTFGFSTEKADISAKVCCTVFPEILRDALSSKPTNLILSRKQDLILQSQAH